MHSSISPYALLCASKPRQMPAAASAYDLRSTMPPSMPAAKAAPSPQTIAQPIQSSSTDTNALPPRRTHYIADIHLRHRFAEKKALLQSSQLL